MSSNTFLDFIDQVYIINLPERVDRLSAILSELARLGITRDSKKINVPYAPRPADAHGFKTKGIYGNFLSHLEILKDARDKEFEKILVLEDDAVFSNRFIRVQYDIVSQLQQTTWNICFPGHSLKKEIKGNHYGLIDSDLEFMWMHCILINKNIYTRLIKYFEETLIRPPGDPLGGRMYIDGAYNMFRRMNKDVITFIYKPALSLQRGGPSSLSENKWYDQIFILRPIMSLLRFIRDELWRKIG